MIEVVGFGAALASFGALAVAMRRGLRRDVTLLLGSLLLLAALVSLRHALRLNGIVRSEHPGQYHLEMLQPLLWGFVMYSVIQAGVQRQIQEKTRSNRLLLSNLPQRIYCKDKHLTNISVNDAFARDVGMEAEQIVGKTDLELFSADAAQRYRADDLRVIESGEPHTRVEEKGTGEQTRIMEVCRIPVMDEGGRLTGLLGIVTDITERTRAQRELAKIEREEAAVLDSMSEAVVYLDEEMNIRWANNAAARVLETDPDGVSGSLCHQLWHSRDEPCHGCPAVEARASGEPAEGRVEMPDGKVWFIRAYPVYGPEEELLGIVEVAEDVTAEERAAAASAQLAAVVEASDDAIIGLTPDGTVTSWNPGAERIYGYKAEEFVGRNLEELMSTQLGRDLNLVFQRVLHGESRRHYETRTVTRDGRLIYASLTLSPIYDESGRVTGVSAIARDITEQVRLREELRMLSLVDTLTELHNRRGFFHLATQELKVATRIGESALLIFADVDNMKRINDTHGHPEGDRALIAAAEVLRETFRQSDVIGRVGGDEFAVLALDAKTTDRDEIMSRLEEAVRARNHRLNSPWDLSLSVGVARFNPRLSGTLDELMAAADALMYEHKRSKFDCRAPAPGR